MRRREEDACQRELAKLESARRAIEDDLRRRQGQISEGKSDLRRALVGALDVGALRQQAAATMSVDRLARSRVLELAGQEQRIAKARAILVEATRRRRAIELLRERRYDEWRSEEHRRENNLLDELGAIAAGRKAREAAADLWDEPDTAPAKGDRR